MKIALGSLLATVAVFVWGAVFWMNPLPYSFLGKTPNDAAVGKALLAQFPATGSYFIPGQYNDQKTQTDLCKAGAIATVHIQREGSDMMPPQMFVMGFLHDLVTVILIGWLLRKALPSLGGYCSRVCFVAMAGLAAGFFCELTTSIWTFVPWALPLINTVYIFTAWLVAGLVLAAFVKPKPAAVAPTAQS